MEAAAVNDAALRNSLILNKKLSDYPAGMSEKVAWPDDAVATRKTGCRFEILSGCGSRFRPWTQLRHPPDVLPDGQFTVRNPRQKPSDQSSSSFELEMLWST